MLLFASVAKVFVCKMTSNEKGVIAYKKHKDEVMDFRSGQQRNAVHYYMQSSPPVE